MRVDATAHADEVARGDRFEFGKNWLRFLALLTEDRIEAAERSLCQMLGLSDLNGLRFLDVGSGSGLFSLAARRRGATVHSFDYDPQSVACTRELRRRYFDGDASWSVQEGSILDEEYVALLGTHDIVYSWGVLHHTGQMWRALDNTCRLVADKGYLFIAVYNDMGPESVAWRRRKKRYATLSRPLRAPYAALAVLPYEIKDLARAILRARPGDYLRSWTEYEGHRGMSRWRDIVDWVGGYPYEVATVEEVVQFCGARGLSVVRVETTGGLGCNEYLFRRRSPPGAANG